MIVLISLSSNVSVSVFTDAPLSDMDGPDVVSTCVYRQARGLYVRVTVSRGYVYSVKKPGDQRQPKLPLCRGLGGRNSASNIVLAPLMNGWRGRTCGVGRLSTRGANVWRADGEVAPSPSPHRSHTPGLYSCSVR